MKRDQLVSTWTPFEELNSWNWQLNMQVVIDFTLDSNGNFKLTHPCDDFPIGKSYNYRFLIVTINELLSIIRPFEASYGVSFSFKIVWFQCRL